MRAGDLADRVARSIGQDPAVRSVQLVGSRAEGRATDRSDWDFRIEVDDFTAVAKALPALCRSLDPLAQQWDRLSPHQCYMLILPGPVKVDLIFANEPHRDEPPWVPSAGNLSQIDAHFWDWMLWLWSKDRPGNQHFVEVELAKLLDHLLLPLGVEARPKSIQHALALYRTARRQAERRYEVKLPTTLEREVSRYIEN